MSRIRVEKLFVGTVLIVGIYLSLAFSADAAEIRVPSVFPTIQAGIAAAVDGDAVIVDPGTYTECIDFLGKEITVASSAGPEVTVIEGGSEAQGAIVTIDDCGQKQCILRGFTLLNGDSSTASSVHINSSSPRIEGNIIARYPKYSSIWAPATVLVTDSQDQARHSSPIIERNIFRDCDCYEFTTKSGILVLDLSNSQSSPRVTNNLFTSNRCAAISLSGSTSGVPEVANNTIIGNSIGVLIRCGNQPPAHPSFKNNIIVANVNGLNVFDDEIPDEFSWQNNLVWGNSLTPRDYIGIPDQTGINGNISEDPLFLKVEYAGGSKILDLPENDFHLCFGSPAIEAGDAESVDPTSTDLDGTPRVLNGRVDIGAYQFDPSEPPRVWFEPDVTSGAVPLTVHFTSTSTTPVSEYLWDFGDGTTSTEANPTHTFERGTYTVMLTVSALNGTDTETRTDLVRALEVYTIKASASPGGSISPEGTSTVTEGSKISYSVSTLDSRIYYLDALIVDGVNVGRRSSYEFRNVDSDHTIAAVFADCPVITASAGVGGSISPAGAATVFPGQSMTYGLRPDPGYRLIALIVDGENVGARYEYTFEDIVTDHTIAAFFAHYFDYFGMEAGNWKNFNVRYSNGKIGRKNTRVHAMDNHSEFYVDVHDLGISGNYYQVSASGLSLTQEGDFGGHQLEFDPPMPVVRTPLTANTTWSAVRRVLSNDSPGRAKITAKVFPKVLVSVPAGHFMAYPIKYRLDVSYRAMGWGTLYAYSGEWVDWFVPFFGAVKTSYISPNKKDVELTSFSIGSKTVSTVPPVVTRITPGSAKHGTPIRIRGFQFGGLQGSSTVRIGNADCDQILSWADNSITCIVPDSATSGPVTVTTDTWSSNDSVKFRVLIPPVIKRVMLSKGKGGIVIEILGEKFGKIQGTVKLGKINAKIRKWNENSITCIVPTAICPRTCPVTVISPKGQSVSRRAFTIIK